MPYNTSKACVKRQQTYLDDMLNAKKTISWPARDAHTFARKIREAMFAAKCHDEYERYHDLKAFYRIRPRKGWVEAEYLGHTEESRAQVPERMVVEEVIDVHGAVGACIKLAPKSDELNFPNAILGKKERLAIYEWGIKQEPKWKLISHENAGITMTRKRGVDPVFLWSPPEKEDD